MQYVVEELESLGLSEVVPGKAGVSFRSASLSGGYRAALWLRCAIRVLVKLGEGRLDTPELGGRNGAELLYDLVRDCGVRWQEVIRPGCSFEVAVRLRSCSDLNSSQLVWQRVKDAVCDAVYDARRERPQPPGVNGPDVPLFVAAYQDQVTLYRDLCGTSLHRRGYRDAMHRAPLNEAAAAGMLMMAGWHRLSQQGAVLADPMCGSGTLLLEAGLMASRRAPGLARHSGSWPFTRWHDFDSQGWRQVQAEARDLVQPWGGRLYGNDTHQAALRLASRDLGRAGLLTQCRLHQGDAASWTLPQRSDDDQDAGEERGGHRGLSPDLEPGDEGQLESSWRSLATFLRAQCPDATALVLSGNKNAFNYLRMKTFRKWPLTVGGVEARVHAYHVLPPKSASHAAESSAEGAVAITV
ncbi:S-adenosyl-L-methionine-dependent methyltransferase [Haematococcus lacustris]